MSNQVYAWEGALNLQYSREDLKRESNCMYVKGCFACIALPEMDFDWPLCFRLKYVQI
jgi:hypothetical protein